jgi:hypothetical protein
MFCLFTDVLHQEVSGAQEANTNDEDAELDHDTVYAALKDKTVAGLRLPLVCQAVLNHDGFSC